MSTAEQIPGNRRKMQNALKALAIHERKQKELQSPADSADFSADSNPRKSRSAQVRLQDERQFRAASNGVSGDLPKPPPAYYKSLSHKSQQARTTIGPPIVINTNTKDSNNDGDYDDYDDSDDSDSSFVDLDSHLYNDAPNNDPTQPLSLPGRRRIPRQGSLVASAHSLASSSSVRAELERIACCAGSVSNGTVATAASTALEERRTSFSSSRSYQHCSAFNYKRREPKRHSWSHLQAAISFMNDDGSAESTAHMTDQMKTPQDLPTKNTPCLVVSSSSFRKHSAMGRNDKGKVTPSTVAQPRKLSSLSFDNDGDRQSCINASDEGIISTKRSPPTNNMYHPSPPKDPPTPCPLTFFPTPQAKSNSTSSPKENGEGNLYPLIRSRSKGSWRTALGA